MKERNGRILLKNLKKNSIVVHQLVDKWKMFLCIAVHNIFICFIVSIIHDVFLIVDNDGKHCDDYD